MTYLAVACRWLVAGSFLLAGAAKARRSNAVSVKIQRTLHLPSKVARGVARWLAPFELALGGLLAAGLATSFAGFLATVTMVAFTTFLVAARARDPNFDCGCFGSDHGAVTWVSIARNVVLAGAGIVVFLGGQQPLSVDDYLGSSASATLTASDGLAVAAATSAALVGVLLVAEAIRAARAQGLLRDAVWAEIVR